MSYLGWTILAAILLATATLFFSAAAIALRTFSSARLKELVKNGNRERHAEKIIESEEKLTLTCSLYRSILTLCLLLAFILIFDAIRDTSLTPGDYTLALIISAIVISIVGLAVPNAWAKYSAEPILSAAYPLLRFFCFLAWPVLRIFGLCDALIKRLAGVPEATEEEMQDQKEEEFLSDLEQQKIEGVVDAEEAAMIENVLELTDTTVGEILTPRTDVIAINVKADLRSVLQTITSAGHSRFPVYEENIDKIIGLAYAKDLLKEIGKDPAGFKLRDKLRQAYFVPETKLLRELLHEFQTQKLHIAVILDEYGGTAGIVTLEDISEELVGEIADEYEKSSPAPIKKITPDTIEVDARTYVDDLNDEFELNLPEDEDYDTVGGFVFSHLGYIPKPSEQFEYENLRFTVTAAAQRRVERLQIQILPAPNEDA